jgi:lysophospholipase L1-like esterase
MEKHENSLVLCAEIWDENQMPVEEIKTYTRRISAFVVGALLFVLDIAWIIALFFLPLIWLYNPVEFRCGPAHFTAHWGLKPALFVVLLPIVRAGLWRLAKYFLKIPACGLWALGWYRKMAFSLAVVIVFFAAVESILTAVDFKFEMPAIIFEGKNEFGGIEVSHTVPDTELLYRFKPGDYFSGRQINSMGFREREVDPVKKEGFIRLICMGDSVTAQGLPGYSEYLNELLAAKPPTAQPWEAFNMGVHGYSIQQGLILFRRQVRQLKPDIVTVYFGWNDHWLEAQSDEMMMAVRVSPVVGKIFDRLREKRTFMALHWVINSSNRQKRDQNNRVLRVPPQRYEALLKQFVSEIRAIGAIPVLITAACRSMTDDEVGKRRIRSKEQGNSVHQQYVAITRAVAKETGAQLFDLEAIFKAPECDRYFAADGIHFDQYAAEGVLAKILPPENQPGLKRVALELYKFLEQLVSGPEWQKRKKI